MVAENGVPREFSTPSDLVWVLHVGNPKTLKMVGGGPHTTTMQTPIAFPLAKETYVSYFSFFLGEFECDTREINARFSVLFINLSFFYIYKKLIILVSDV